MAEKVWRVPTISREQMIHVERDMVLAEADAKGPSVMKCRYAVLPLANDGWVVYDRLLSRIVDGVYYINPEGALGVARWFNESAEAAQDSQPPNGDAMGLIYP